MPANRLNDLHVDWLRAATSAEKDRLLAAIAEELRSFALSLMDRRLSSVRKSEAEDAAHEVTLNVVEAVRARKVTNLRQYANFAVRNQLINVDHGRGKGKYKRPDPESAGDSLSPGRFPDILDVLVADCADAERASAVRSALDQLNSNYRAFALAFFFDGLSLEELAEREHRQRLESGKTDSTVAKALATIHQRKHRTLNALRKLLAEVVPREDRP